jgi:TPR repeat protein
MTFLIKVLDKGVIILFPNEKRKVLYTFVYFTPRVFLASAPAYAMSLTHVERLRAIGYGLKGKLVLLLSLGTNRYFEQKYNWKACHKMMACIAHRITSKNVALMRDKAANQAKEMCALGKCAAAQVPLQLAISLGHLPSCALMAWLLIDGREGVYKNHNKAFKLVEEGARLGCHHCQGVMACCYRYGFGIPQDTTRSLELAHKSSGKGSRYGQYMLGRLYECDVGGVAQNHAQAVALYRLAAAQNFDRAQINLGSMHYDGIGVVQDYAEALRLFHLAAAQGNTSALNWVARCYELGHGVRKNKSEAIHWYRRAKAAD